MGLKCGGWLLMGLKCLWVVANGIGAGIARW